MRRVDWLMRGARRFAGKAEQFVVSGEQVLAAASLAIPGGVPRMPHSLRSALNGRTSLRSEIHKGGSAD